MLNDFKDLQQVASWYIKRLALPIIPICSHDHLGMSSNHKEKCSCPGKMPLLSGWNTKSNTTLENLREWFSTGNKLNLGMVLGETDNWNFVGLDIDGETGEELLAEWSQGVVPQTWEFKTGKGRRLIYLLPEGAKSKKFKEANPDGGHQELALMATGQQTVMPPSKHHTGFIYSWTGGCSPEDLDVADAPQWILNRVVVNESTNFYMPSGEINVDVFNEVKSEPTVDDDWTKTVSSGGRNTHLLKLAGTLIAKKNVPKTEVMTFLSVWNKDHCKPPLAIAEIEKMVDSLFVSETLKMAKKELAKKQWTNSEAAQRFLNAEKEKGWHWRYTVTRKSFYRSDELVGPWKVVEDLIVQKHLRDYLIPIDIRFDTSNATVEVFKALSNALITLEDNSDDIFNMGTRGDIQYIQLENGMYDWKKKELVPWDLETYSTIRIEARWDPNIDKTLERETWERVLTEWIPDPIGRNYLQEYVGYCLLPTCNFRTATFLLGGGANGKSLFLDIIQSLFTKHLTVVPLNRLAERFETVQLVDSLINICADVDSGYLPETGALKGLIAGDPMRAERKFGGAFHFKPITRYIFSANTLPKVKDKSEGWLSRWRYVSFPNKFPINPSYKDDLIALMTSNIGKAVLVDWAIEGVQRLYTSGVFSESQDMRDVAKEYKHENDTVAAFLETALLCVEHTGKETQLSTIVIYNLYKNWATEIGAKAVGQIEFTKRAQQLAFRKVVRPVKGKSTNVFIGVELNPDFADVDLKTAYNMENSIKSSLG